MPMKVNLPPGLEATANGRDLIKTAEFAHTVNVSEQTIRKNYSQTGACYGIRPLKVGRHLLWPVQDIAQLLKEGVQ